MEPITSQNKIGSDLNLLAICFFCSCSIYVAEDLAVYAGAKGEDKLKAQGRFDKVAQIINRRSSLRQASANTKN